MQLGDLNRFKAAFERKLVNQTQDKTMKEQLVLGEQTSIAQARSFYDRAKTVFPYEGKIFHHLGALSA
jgi:hypothetical protein